MLQINLITIAKPKIIPAKSWSHLVNMLKVTYRNNGYLATIAGLHAVYLCDNTSCQISTYSIYRFFKVQN